MTPDQTSLEAELRALRAVALDDSFMQRLEAAADGTLEQLTPAELRFEQQLKASSPSRLSSDFMAELEAIVRDVPFPKDEKILLFPKGGPTPQVRKQRPIWSAAAAVALIGAATALLMPDGKQPASRHTASTLQPMALSAGASSGNFVPASFNRGVSEVHDEGVVWKENQPHTMVRVVYKELVTLTDKKGRTFQVEQPKVKWVLIPAKAD